ncbi:hypothetical protein CERSUDRAFT_116256 [Gelatoporia subvermispora B]|uniref:non-specific serine/threonine protein kinase n=1 Tax=Ceriporiopsis subvermispora (strain B) TaxID=914234 RepID=M2QEP0_CERS8|nr:hypothetical protein CERSUDRAFT_116256 [Gelatoporia subvermispora B]
MRLLTSGLRRIPTVLRLSNHILHTVPRQSSASTYAPKAICTISADQRAPGVPVFTLTSSQDGQNILRCDEEPHMDHLYGDGYIPLNLGQFIIDTPERKLEVVRKLGFGRTCNVWLAKDHRGQYPTRYVAVKVLTEDKSRDVEMGTTQIELAETLHTIYTADMGHSGYASSANWLLYDTFSCSSIHGNHVCLVTNPLGPDTVALHLSRPGLFLPLRQAKQVVRQLLLALDYLHTTCGVIYSDLTPSNVLVSLNDADEEIGQYLRTHPSKTYDPQHIPQLSPSPIVTVRSQPLFIDDARRLQDFSVSLVDFHAAVSVDKCLRLQCLEPQPTYLCAPEVALGHTWSTPIDIWALGCIVSFYLTGRLLSPIPTLIVDGFSYRQDYMDWIRQVVGPYPSAFLSSCRHRKVYLNHQGEPIKRSATVYPSIRDILHRNPALTEHDTADAEHFIRRCLTIDPKMRPTARDLLSDDWLKKS